MDKPTRLDKLLTWFKNNRFFAIAMLVAIGIVAASQLVTSISSLVQTGGHLLSKSLPAVPRDEPAFTPTPESVAAAPEPSLVKEVLRFGAAGTGPGHFEDARWIVITPQGVMLVAEYVERGRIQRFDLNGQFLSQWFAKDKNYGSASVHDIAFEIQQGLLYAIQVWDVYRYDPTTGKERGELARQENFNSAAALASDPRGGVIALWANEHGGMDLIRYVPGADRARVVKRDLLKEHFKHHPTSVSLAVDGLGNMYVIAQNEDEAMLKFSPDGEFLDLIGSPGDGPGQWNSPETLAVDGKGRVFVVAFNGIHVIDASGRYEGKFKSNCPGMPVSARALAFDLKGYLYVLCGDAVIKYELDIP